MLVSKWLRPPASQAQNSFERIRNKRLFVLSQADSDNWADKEKDIWLVWTNQISGAFGEDPCLEGPVYTLRLVV